MHCHRAALQKSECVFEKARGESSMENFLKRHQKETFKETRLQGEPVVFQVTQDDEIINHYIKQRQKSEGKQ